MKKSLLHNIKGKKTLPSNPALGVDSKFVYASGSNLAEKFSRIRAQMSATKIVAITKRQKNGTE